MPLLGVSGPPAACHLMCAASKPKSVFPSLASYPQIALITSDPASDRAECVEYLFVREFRQCRSHARFDSMRPYPSE